MAEETTKKKGGYSMKGIEDDRLIIVPNPEKKGNYAKCHNIELKRMGKLEEGVEEGSADDDRKWAIVFQFIEEETDAALDYPCFQPMLLEEDEDDKAKVDMYNNGLKRIKQMFNSFCKEKSGINTDAFEGESFEDLYKFYMKNIDPNYKDVRCKLKVVYNKKGNVTLGTIGSVISSEYRKRMFDWNPKYDFVVRKEGSDKKADSFDDDDDGDL